MTEILFLTHNRKEFTEAALKALLDNTDWSLVEKLWLFDDGSTDGTLEIVQQFSWDCPITSEVVRGTWGSPVEAMRDFFERARSMFVVKIDSDVMLPVGWLNSCVDVMDAEAGVDVLGIEARGKSSEEAGPARIPRRADKAEFIGGIGIFRLESLKQAMTVCHLGCDWPSGRWFGWQGFQAHSGLSVAWIKPSLQVFLLDRMPMEPWKGLSDGYVLKGWQRPAPYLYGPEWSGLWSWFEVAV